MANNLFIILSLKHSEGNKPCFWRPDNSGYTHFPWGAGIYSKDEVEADPEYYNDGINTLAIPLSNEGMETLGFSFTMNLDKVAALRKQVLAERRKEISHD